MSSIGSISPLSNPFVPLDGAQRVSQTAAPASTETAADERLRELLASLEAAGSGVGLTGLRLPSAPGDTAVLLAQATLALETTSDESAASRAKLTLSKVLAALQAYDPAAAEALSRTEAAAKDAATVRKTSLAGERAPIETRITAAQGDVDRLNTSISAQDAAITATQSRIDELKTTKDFEKNPDYIAAVGTLAAQKAVRADLAAELATRSNDLAAAKADLVDVAVRQNAAAAALLDTEIARLPESTRKTAAQAERAALTTSATALSTGGADARYAAAVGGLAALDTLLGAKITQYAEAAAAALGLAKFLQTILTAAAAHVAAQANAALSAASAVGGERGRQIDTLLSRIIEEAGEMGRSASLSDPARQAEEGRRTEAGENADALARLVAARLAALADLASTLAALDPLTIHNPALQPGRSRVRLDV